ncbi:MAG: hypothetical protein NT031_02790 [Planctomycetota bacterium]|nr:hypothetical protein [Planctomycetota bacterium]
MLVLAAAWAGGMAFSCLYVVPTSPWGALGDGSGQGYPRARAFGVAYGCLVMQTKGRVSAGGWQVERTDFHFRLGMVREFVEGRWTHCTSGVSLLLPVMALGIWCGLTWYGRRPSQL